jgi:pheromone shutdown protein TraB
MFKDLSAFLLVLSLAAASVTGQAASVTALDVTAVIELAATTQQRARDVGHGWTITDGYLSAARSQLAQNERDVALVSAQRALFTANRAIEQAGNEAKTNAWQPRVPAL